MALFSKSEKKNNVLQEIMKTSLLKNPLFIIFTLSNFCTSIGFNVPYVYLLVNINLLFTFLRFQKYLNCFFLFLQPQAEERGINKSLASYLLAIIGIANTIGRIILGYISDKPWINRLLVYNICLTICGIGKYWFLNNIEINN